MVVQLIINPAADKSGFDYVIPVAEREKSKYENIFQFPDGGVLISKDFVRINPDFTVKYDTSPKEPRRREPKSPFDVLPHRGSNSCPYYEAFQPGTKIYSDFQAAWWKPMFNGAEMKLANREERITYLKSIGGDELVKEFTQSHSLYTTDFCLFCFQNNYLRCHLKHLERITDEFTGSAKTERAEANSFISFRMMITATTDYRTILGKIFKQDAFPVKRWSYVKQSDTEIKGIYQTYSNNMIKSGYISRYYRGDFQQSRCLSMDDVGTIIGAEGVTQGGDWDSD